MKKIIFSLCIILACSACQTNLSLISYNIQHGKAADGSTSTLQRISQIIKGHRADVVFLQELDSMNKRTPLDEAKVLGDMTKMYAQYGATINYAGGKYGIALLSRERPISVRKIKLPGREEGRAFLLAEFKSYYAGCTHLSLTDEDRLESAKIIVSIISKLDKPVFIGGDFNDKPYSATYNYLAKSLECLSDTAQHTYPADNPKETIDFIWAKDFKGKVLHHETIDEPTASDHRPILVKVKR